MFAELEGTKLYYEDVGQGEPVVLIAGINSNHRFWKGMVPLLEGYRVITVDNPGVGETEYEGDITIERVADDISNLMVFLGIDIAHIVGWSWGSQIAQSLAARHPEKLQSLTLVSSYMRRPARSAYFMGSIAKLAIGNPNAMEAMNVCFNAFCLPETKFAELENKGIQVPIPKHPEKPEEVIKQMLSMNEFDSSESNKTIKTPTLVIHGGVDIMVEPILGRAVRDSIKGCIYHEIPGEGHTIAPELYIDYLREFLSDNKM